MEDKHTGVFVGLFLALAVFSLAFGTVILFFGEFESLDLALRGGTILALLSAAGYGVAEAFVYPRAKKKSLLAISYFLTFAVLAALIFRFTASSHLFGAFRGQEETARSLLRVICSRLCAANAAALFLRILAEIVRYVKSFLRH